MKGNLSRKLLTYFLIVIVLSLSSVGVVTYTRASKELDEQSARHMSQIVNNAMYQTDLYLQNYDRAMTSLLSNQDVKQFIDMPRIDGYDYYSFYSSIKAYGIKPLFISNPEINNVYIISYNENAIFAFNSGYDQPLSPPEVHEQLQMLKQRTKDNGLLSALNTTILPERKNSVITLARKIKGLSSPNFNGILAFEVQSRELSTLWGGIDLGEEGYFFIMDESGEIVYHPQREMIGTMVPDKLREQIGASDAQMFEGGEGNKKQAFVSRKSAYSGWTLVVSMPLDQLKKPISSIRTTTIAIGLVTLVLAIWLSQRFGLSITRPIRVLKNGMRQTEKGNWVTIPVNHYEPKDEIDELTFSYNLMVKRLSELVKQVYEAELTNRETQLERQKAEFQSLQMQINPHFLYNTLETIACYAALKDSDEISEIVKAMAYMLRYSVQTNLEEITVANELKHVLTYMVILRHRIDYEFEIDAAVPPKYLLHKMVRLTLQPLVENIFQHAFPEGVEPHHYIRVDAGEEDGIFWVSVEDNGEGIPEAKLAELNERLSSYRLTDDHGSKERVTGGIGIVNVHRRIQMVFGEEYGLRIESKAGEGTKIFMLMPMSSQGRSDQ
ncbi:histidine kinase [Paenibacillus doosanensis]|uniref:cache domain-containing sensor histidine kinase n=1 Tax=Paenibacillus doosanensis TaxID=1229154 RepID=UPI0021808E68|nr:histidine kinase [Paenibacillus doosanensis]MCS7461055.1 histidine kinase [Paenibacillus doosanensis]